jgi:uncharacterized protein YprB with RNaseH-like and TPR domain
MLRHTFQHIPGLGERRERTLWRRGIYTWDELLAAPQRSGLPATLLSDAQAIIHLSEEALRQRNIYFFAQLLPAREHWRLYGEFHEVTAYLDIETGPLGNGRQGITVIGLFDGREFRSFVHGSNLHTFEDYLRRYDLLVTFNGKTFDLPLIERELGIPIYQAQIDMRVFLHHLGYRGGLKRIERQWGIIREDDIAGLTGFDAVLLWARYRRGDREALERLIAYNRADVVNLEVLLKRGYERAREQVEATVHVEARRSALSSDVSSCARSPSPSCSLPFDGGGLG